MKYSTLFLGFMLSSLVVGSIVFTGCKRRSDETHSVSEPIKIKVYYAEKKGFIITETVSKTQEEWKKQLTPEQYHILREKGTEKAFTGKYADYHEHGIYRCAACELDLFRSEDKYDSGTGWPSFTKPIADENIITKQDNTLFSQRTEVLCRRCNSHIGHVFNDGPRPTGLRYCMNSAALQFVSTMSAGNYEKATFAGGCFWCMEHPFDEIPGVVSVTSGYTGGHKKNPTYKEVSDGGTGHAESVQIVYDPARVTYEKLLNIFWHNIDPTTKDRQFCDSGHQYRSAIFYHNEEQRQLALKSKAQLENNKTFKEPVVTEIEQATEFYPAEEYHQHYYKKNPIRYKFYRFRCGRDQRLKELWGDAADH